VVAVKAALSTHYNKEVKTMEFDKVKEIVADQMGISADDITMESSFTDDIGADSLDIFQIISELEDAFDIEFANDDAENIKTVGDAVEYIKNANAAK
jgi:acyl carrier protein